MTWTRVQGSRLGQSRIYPRVLIGPGVGIISFVLERIFTSYEEAGHVRVGGGDERDTMWTGRTITEDRATQPMEAGG